MRLHGFSSFKRGFTLIELLVVIAIIAVLAVVVVLVLNPAELLRQSRDANRLSDMATLNSALNLYITDQSGTSGFSLGNASSVYLSLPDTTSTCANLGLPTTSPSGFVYACSSSTSSRNINSFGWIPVNLSSLSAGSPLGALPVDPINQSSSGLYYTYSGNGTQFEVTSIFESQKYKTQYGQNPILPSYPEVDAVGNSLSIDPLFSPTGLVGYWPLDEGMGSSTIDGSGNGNAGAWAGTPVGASGYYSPGKVGSWAGAFNGTNDSVAIPTIPISSLFNAFTMVAWVNGNNPSGNFGAAVGGSIYSGTGTVGCDKTAGGGGSFFSTNFGSGGTINLSGGTIADNSWHFLVCEWNAQTGVQSIYIDGKLSASTTATATTTVPNDGVVKIGFSANASWWSGLLDDVRVYNRTLSAAEVQAMYSAEK